MAKDTWICTLVHTQLQRMSPAYHDNLSHEVSVPEYLSSYKNVIDCSFIRFFRLSSIEHFVALFFSDAGCGQSLDN